MSRKKTPQSNLFDAPLTPVNQIQASHSTNQNDAHQAVALLANNPFSRADYAKRTQDKKQDFSHGAWIEKVQEGSPAWEAGLEPGMRIETCDGHTLRDLIDWRWYASDASVVLSVYDPRDNNTYEATLERTYPQDWGIEFYNIIFDELKTCVNNCAFCFMKMLPKDARASLKIRDDDYRLSFLQGNFVTLTNVSDEEATRMVERRLEPVNVSLHAITPQVRTSLIGRHAARGIEVLEYLCEHNLEIHAQIVVCPGLNDGEELSKTLAYVEAHPSITSCALVPMGYTKYQKRFSSSYSDDPVAAHKVIAQVSPFQKRARKTLGISRFVLSDEFYLCAHEPLPPSSDYDGYPQFYDGIGMLRYSLEEADDFAKTNTQLLVDTTHNFINLHPHTQILLVCGEAALEVYNHYANLLNNLAQIQLCQVQAICNNYYGGDVNVTGLICAPDLLDQLPKDLCNTLVVLPSPMFNFDGDTLDGSSYALLSQELGTRGAITARATPLLSSFVETLKELC